MGKFKRIKWKYNCLPKNEKGEEIESKYEEDADVHIWLGRFNSDTLCGLEHQGTSSQFLERNEFIETKSKITCDNCLQILNFCK